MRDEHVAGVTAERPRRTSPPNSRDCAARCSRSPRRARTPRTGPSRSRNRAPDAGRSRRRRRLARRRSPRGPLRGPGCEAGAGPAAIWRPRP
jgi:hypothetical protein